MMGAWDNSLRLVASPDGADGSLTIHQDAKIYLSKIDAGKQLVHALNELRHAWVQVLRGAVAIGDVHLDTGDGETAISEERELQLVAQSPSEIMLFDLN